MSPTCLFRLLPKHILETIFQYTMPICENKTKQHSSTSALRTDLLDSLGPEWREVALEHYFKNFTLTFDTSDNLFPSHQFSECLIPVDREYFAIKTVKMCFSLNDLVSGSAAQMLAQSEYSSLVYPSVKTIKLDINEFYGSDRDADDDTSSPSFYQQLMRMFPAASRVRILTGPNTSANIGDTGCEFEEFLLDLHDKYEGLCTTVDLKGSFKCDLTSMHSTITQMRLVSDYSSQMGLLIEECAPTIESLEMHVYVRHDVYNVLVDSHGKPIEYPRLTSLTLSVPFHKVKSNVVCPLVLMPRLSRLVIDGQYPFTDDVIFRCTRSTLTYANIQVYSEFTEILRNHRVFMEPEYPKIRHIKIGYYRDMNSPVMSDEYWSYVSNISQRLRGLSISRSIDISTYLKLTIGGPTLSNIRYLKLETVALTFNSFCFLVEKLPHMTQFSIKGVSRDIEHEHTSHIELHDHFTSRWCPLSLCLQSCDLTYGYDIAEMVACALLLVALCPRVTRFMANIEKGGLIQDAIHQEIDKAPFNIYADRLKYLVVNGIAKSSNSCTAF